MEKWIVEFNGKKSDPVSMVRVFHKAVSMYVKEKGVVSKKEVLSELVPQSRMYSESRRNKLLITKDNRYNKYLKLYNKYNLEENVIRKAKNIISLDRYFKNSLGKKYIKLE